MPLIGVTGGLATGKSTVTRLFRERGAVTFSADEAARAILEPPSPVLGAIAEAFGVRYLTPDGLLDRAALGAHVFAHPEDRRRLEALTHPAILDLLRRQVDQARADGHELIVVEAPLLYEAGMADWFDAVVVVTADEQTQLRRLLERDGMPPEEALRRIRSQMPLSEKAARAHHVIRNEGDLAELEREVEDVVNRWGAG